MKCTGGCQLVAIGGLAGVSIICLILVFLNQWYGCLVANPRMESMLASGYSSENTKHFQDAEIEVQIQEIIDTNRRIIRSKMADYPFLSGKYNTSATTSEDLVIEENGRPIRSIIVSTYRSGSSFLGGIIGADPRNFYHFEPLTDFDFVQIRGPPLAEKALEQVRKVLNCEYETLDDFLAYEKSYPVVLNKSTPLWERCQPHGEICWDHRYLSALCKLFPLQLTKFVRLRLNVAQELLADDKFAVKLVLLVRDPRGIMQSRKRVFFYEMSPDASDPALLCADLVSDYKVAVKLKQKYPNTFRVIRYEDFAADPYKNAEELFQFYGRSFHPDVTKYLDTHTRADIGDSFSNIRNTKTAPYHWRTDLQFEEVDEIQRVCGVAMKYWGYVPAMNATHQREFNPVSNYDLSLDSNKKIS